MISIHPRLADIGGARYWRLDPRRITALDRVARHRINPDLIRQNWEDMLRFGGSLKLGAVQATSIMRTLRIGDRPSKLALAVGELGRIEKTIHVMASPTSITKPS